MRSINKKADLSMSTIVMAVIAVLIMIILAGMVIRNGANTNKVITSCTDKGGRCSYDSCSTRTDGYLNTNPTWTCSTGGVVDDELVCCVP